MNQPIHPADVQRGKDAWLTRKMHAENAPTPPGALGPVNRDNANATGISMKLRGASITADPSAAATPPAPTGVDQAVWDAAQASASDPQSPDYDLASALLVVAQHLADLTGHASRHLADLQKGPQQ